MDSFKFDNVKAEKADAMRRYNRQRQSKNFLRRLLQAFVALAFLRWSSPWILILSNIANEHLHKLIVAIDRPFFVFLFMNAIILGLALIGKNGAPSNIYNEYVANSSSLRMLSTGGGTQAPEELPEEPPEEPPEETQNEQQAVKSENAVSPVDRDTVTTVTTVIETGRETELAASPTQLDTVATTVTEVKQYRRTQSESFEREKKEKNRRKLRRSDTRIGREMVVAGRELERRMTAMEDMSNEEFRKKVESFIAEKKRNFIEEK